MEKAKERIEELLRKGKPNSAAVVFMNNSDQFSPEIFKELDEKIRGKNWATTNNGSPACCRNSFSRKMTANM